MHTLRLLWAAQNEDSWLRRRKRYNLREKLEKVEVMSEEMFVQHFKLNKTTFKNLCQEIRTLRLIKGSQETPLEVKILAALSFLATGSHQKLVGIGLHLTQRTTSRCIREFVDALNNKLIISKWIVLPQTTEERSQIEKEYQRNYKIPGVIGCIGCTHISIVKPDENRHLYLNKKGNYSINVEMICDVDLRILNVNAKFGGATHDSQIWATSQVEKYMRELHDNGEHVWLLGDSMYPLRPWLMTPIPNAQPGSREELYTTRHVQARSSIDHCIELLKGRWRCLLGDKVLHYHPNVASKIIKACCVLHNIAVDAQIPPPRDIPIDNNTEYEDDMPDSDTGNDLIRGRAMLSCLIKDMD